MKICRTVITFSNCEGNKVSLVASKDPITGFDNFYIEAEAKGGIGYLYTKFDYDIVNNYLNSRCTLKEVFSKNTDEYYFKPWQKDDLVLMTLDECKKSIENLTNGDLLYKDDPCRHFSPKQKSRIAYLHGLGGINHHPKNIWLHRFADAVYDPQIIYGEENLYNRLENELNDFKPDIIVGSSMGGLYSFFLGSELNIPTLLFNPAIHSFNPRHAPDLPLLYNNNIDQLRVILGEDDDLIDPHTTIEILNNTYSITNVHKLLPEVGHPIPIDIFMKEIKDFTLLMLNK